MDDELECICCGLPCDEGEYELNGGRCDECSSGFCPMGYCSEDGEFFDDEG